MSADYDEDKYQQLLAESARKIQLGITVYDEMPDKIMIDLTGEWGRAIEPTEEDRELVNKVITHITSLFEYKVVDNVNLIKIGKEIEEYTKEHYPDRVLRGDVRIRRAKKNLRPQDVADYGLYKYRYVVHSVDKTEKD